jgi:S1-C subfamily serine protease
VFAPAPVAAPAQPVAALPLHRRVLERELEDFEGLSQQVGVTPRPSGGFQILHVREGSFVHRLGLRGGDVLLAIDGRPIDTVEDAAKAYAWLRVTDQFRVEILRGGQRITLAFRLVS